MGVGLTKATPIHFSEELAGRKLLRGWSKTSNGDIQEVHMGSCSNGFNNFCSSISHIEETVKVGKSLWRIYPFKKFVSTIADTIKQDPMITHCDNNNCCVCNHVIKGEAIL